MIKEQRTKERRKKGKKKRKQRHRTRRIYERGRGGVGEGEEMRFSVFLRALLN